MISETPKAAAAYSEYAAMGPSRSLRKLAENRDKTGTKPGQNFKQLGEWSSEHNWQERVKAYDAECIEERRQKREAELEQMNSRHALIGTTQQAKAMKQIDELIKAQKFGSQAVVQLLKLALDIERLARGDATDRQEITGKDGGPLIIETQWGTKKVASQDGEEQ